MWKNLAIYVGRMGRRLVMMTLLLLVLLWSADRFLNVGPGVSLGPWIDTRLWALAERASDVVEGMAGNYWDEQTILRMRTERTVRMLEREIERLQWVEAESMTRSGEVEARLDELTVNLEVTRESLVDLAALMRMKPGAIFIDGVRYEGEQIEAHATLRMLEFTALQEEVELYREAATAHRNAAIAARGLWMETMQNIKALEAHQQVLEATLALESAREPGSANSQNVLQLSERLRTELERNRRIVDKRRQLEEGMVDQEEHLPDLDVLLGKSADLAEALQRLASDNHQD